MYGYWGGEPATLPAVTHPPTLPLPHTLTATGEAADLGEGLEAEAGFEFR